MIKRQIGFSLLVLLTSASTLICCVIPALLVAFGLGSVLAAFIGTFPQITLLSEHKGFVFAFAGAVVALAGSWQYFRRNEPCPLDPELAQACTKLRKVSKILWVISLLILALSFLFVYILPRLSTAA